MSSGRRYIGKVDQDDVIYSLASCRTLSRFSYRVYQVANVKSEWDLIKIFPDLSGTGKITSVKFGPDAKYLAVGSMDRNLRIFGLPEDTSMES